MDIAAAVVYLKAHARHFGMDGTPIAVLLSPYAPDVGWRKAAIEFLHENAKKKAAGEPILFRQRNNDTPGMMEQAFKVEH
jgi:hypothetical protein